MRKIYYYKIIFIYLISFSFIYGGEYSFDFLNLGVGTRAKALGCSFVSIADDGSSIFWNPAGTSQASSSRFYFMHNSNFAGFSSIDYISFIKPLIAQSFFSVALLRHYVSEIPIFPELEGTYEERDTTPSMQGDGIPYGYFNESANIYLFNFTKALRIKNNRLSIGGNFKYFDETIYGADGTGIGVDIASIIFFEKKGIPGRLTFGLNIQDATGTQILWNTISKVKDIIPTDYRFGINYRKEFKKIYSSVMVTFDYFTRYGGSKHAGLEYVYKNNFLFDIGWNQGSWSFGTGFKFWKIGIQYGFIPYNLGTSHSISMEVIL